MVFGILLQNDVFFNNNKWFNILAKEAPLLPVSNVCADKTLLISLVPALLMAANINTYTEAGSRSSIVNWKMLESSSICRYTPAVCNL